MDLRTTRSVAVLVGTGLLVGAVLTAVATLADGRHADALTWLSSVATVGALVVAIGIYAVQRRDQDIARQELLDRLDAQDELLADLARQEPADPGGADLTDAQRHEIEKRFGADSIAATWPTGVGGAGEPRLVRLQDGQVVTVYDTGRGRTVVRPIPHGRQRQPRGDRQSRRADARSRPRT